MAKVAAAKKVVKKRRERKNIEKGSVHIQSTFNNTIVTISDAEGNAISWASAGELGFKGSRKSTPFAAQSASETAAKIAIDHGLKTVEVFVKGPGIISRREKHYGKIYRTCMQTVPQRRHEALPQGRPLHHR